MNKVNSDNYFVKASNRGIGNTITSVLDENMSIKILKYSPVKKEFRGIQRKIYPLIISGEAKSKVKIMYNIFDDPSTFGYECYDNIKFTNILLHAYKDEVGRYDYHVVEKGDVELGDIRKCSSTD